ncbi:MAG: HAD-IA family hydrolase [Methylococcales bacterium]
MKNRFDLIVFDWDGTLMDSVDWIVRCLRFAAREQNCDLPSEQQIKNIIGLSIHKAMDILFSELDDIARQQFIDSYSKAFFAREITDNDLFTGVKDMLLHLKQQGYQLAVATGKSRHGLDKALKGTGLKDFFNTTKCADETASKPNPDMLNIIVEELGISKKRVVLIGDSIHDMEMAVNADVVSIAVLCGANSKAQMQAYNPLFNLQKTTELLDIL